jgi:hypothetical protein
LIDQLIYTRRNTMTSYSIALFLHIVGVLGLFVALGLEWTSLVYLRRASTAEQAREWLGVLGGTRRLGPASLVAILLAGFYMVATAWGWTGWIVVALAAMVLIAVVGASLTGLRIGAVGRAATAESGLLSPEMRQRLHDPLLWTSVQTRTAIALGIVFLMTVKPDLIGALVTIGLAIILGLASALPNWRRAQTQDKVALS